MQLSLRWQRVIAAGAIVLTAGVLLVRHAVDFKPGARLPGDFGVYFHALERLDAGGTPYVASDFSPYKYSPGALLPLRVLSTQPNHAWLVMKALYLLGWMFSLGVVWIARERREIHERLMPSFSARMFGLALAILLSWKGALEALDYGQLDFFLLPLVFGAVLVFKRSPFLSGVLLAIAPVFKLPWLLLSLPFAIQSLVRKNGIRWFGGWALSAVFGFAVLPAVFLPRSLTLLYSEWFTVLKLQPHELYFNDINQSLWVAFARWCGEGAFASVLGGVAALSLGVYLLVRERKYFQQDMFKCSDEWLSLWLIALLLVNPLSWRWAGLFIAVIPFRKSSGPLALVTVLGLLAFWLIQQNPVAQVLGYKHWSGPHAWSSITVFWLLLLAWLIQTESPKTQDL